MGKKGFVIDKPASLNLGGLPSQTGPRDHPHPLTELAEKLWHSEYAERAEAASSSAPHLWQISHQFALHILQSAGAKWNSGKKVRGDLPSFKEDSDGLNPILPFWPKSRKCASDFSGVSNPGLTNLGLILHGNVCAGCSCRCSRFPRCLRGLTFTSSSGTKTMS